MKKFICAALAAALLLICAGCSETAEKPDTAAPAPSQSAQPAEDALKVTFSTEDLEGNSVNEELMKDAQVVMINFWEPWCSPCVREMPELEKLYQAYKDKGFLVLGIFSTEGADDSVAQVLKACGTTYPILRADESLQSFMTEYVPTTIFCDGEGNLLSAEPVIGAMSYEGWEEQLLEYLK